MDRLARVFSPVFKQLGIPTETHITGINRSDELEEWLVPWRQSLDGTGKSGLESLDTEGALVVGFEMSNRDSEYLTAQSVSWINFAIHPLRFLDDLYFDVVTPLLNP